MNGVLHGEQESLYEAGFISDYSSNQVSDDFVELISHYILSTESDWATTIEEAGDVGGPLINQKIAIIKAYLTSSWSIDMDELRAEIQKQVC
ncbi:putative zinc-binding metallopeptidase [Polaribacter sejongensis]|uniref:substrate import-associated zinc metallohydrolase lipoprotein n=1 Tax=Polaribacter sejongensis TaxID=985043 RepID=UPI0035A5852C